MFRERELAASPAGSLDFEGSHYPKDVILYAVFFYVRYAVSYRDLEEIMAKRGVAVDHATLNSSGANLAGLQNMNWLLLLQGWIWLIEILQVKYLNNRIEQDHRFNKKLTRPMKGFKSFQSASATLDGIEVAHMTRKQQFSLS